MSKITIVSREDQALLIDISGCSSFKEAIEQLSSTFLSANHFWQDQSIDLDFGSLLLSKSQAAQIIALINGVGAQTKQIFARSASTYIALEEMQLVVSKEQSDALLSVSVVSDESTAATSESTESQKVESEGKQELEIKEKESDNETKSKLGKVLVFENSEQSENQVENSNQLLPLGMDAGVSRSIENTAKSIEPENQLSEPKKRNSLYLRQTLRAGQAVSHKGDLIIIGDVNAGAEVMAEGDITIWGSLRGIAHAGIDGDTKAEIRALRLQPIQIRIADAIARSPDRINSTNQNVQFAAETAKLVNGQIRILHKTFDDKETKK
jgi:septum site-determining protein MinC